MVLKESFKLSISLVLITMLLINLLFTAVNTQNVDYKKEALNNWACNQGRRQSPIALSSKDSIYTDQVNVLNDSYNEITDGLIYYNPDNKQVEFAAKANALNKSSGNYGFINIEYNGYIMKFDLQRIFLHVPAEHKIDNEYPDFEIQLYHKKDLKFTSLVNEYRRLPDINEYLVISIPYKVNTNNKIYSSDNGFLEKIKDYYTSSVKNDSKGISIDISDYNLAKNQSFYFYKGSMTFFPCNENHLHFILSDYNSISKETLDKFTISIFKNIYLNGDNIKSSAEIYGRFSYRNFFINQDEANENLDPVFNKEKKRRDDLAYKLKEDKDNNVESDSDNNETTNTLEKNKETTSETSETTSTSNTTDSNQSATSNNNNNNASTTQDNKKKPLPTGNPKYEDSPKTIINKDEYYDNISKNNQVYNNNNN